MVGRSCREVLCHSSAAPAQLVLRWIPPWNDTKPRFLARLRYLNDCRRITAEKAKERSNLLRCTSWRNGRQPGGHGAIK
ncbi:CxxxxCH/CxxCH domain-containing protein [Cupriavidus sp. 2MCAB6]